MRSAIAFGLAVLAFTTACAEYVGRSTTPAGIVRTIAVSAASADPLTSAGDTRVLAALVKDVYGETVPSPDVAWRTSDPAVATVTGSGSGALVTAVGDGTATISATSEGVVATIAVTVQRPVAHIAISASDTVLVAGTATRLTVLGVDPGGTPIAALSNATFVTSNAFSVTVSPDGLLDALYSSFGPRNALVTASVTRADGTLTIAQRFYVASAAPERFDFLSTMLPEQVRPEPLFSVADGVVYLTVGGSGIEFALLWSHLGGRPIGAHLHGPSELEEVTGILADFPVADQVADHGVVRGTLSQESIRARDGRAAISVDSLVALMRNGVIYADVHTAEHPGGEIRGAVIERR